jgi:hypothetical protein
MTIRRHQQVILSGIAPRRAIEFLKKQNVPKMILTKVRKE